MGKSWNDTMGKRKSWNDTMGKIKVGLRINGCGGEESVRKLSRRCGREELKQLRNLYLYLMR